MPTHDKRSLAPDIRIGTRHFRVVVSCTDEVSAERSIVDSVVDRLNRNLALAKIDTQLHVSRWPTDVGLGMHPDGPQGRIDEDLKIAEADVFIGILWRYFGKPTVNGQTPTEHEIRTAFDAWDKKRSPQLLLYFRTSGELPRTHEEAAQLLSVIKFKDEFKDHGVYRPYTIESAFSDSLYDELWRICVAEPIQLGATTIPLLTVTLDPQPRMLRSIGVTELLGDLVFSFSRGEIVHSVASERRYDVTFFVTPGVPITSPIQASGDSSVYLSRIDGPQEGLVAFARPLEATDSGFAGLVFEDLDLTIPEGEDDWRFRIGNVRVAAWMLGVPSGSTRSVSGTVIIRDRLTGTSVFTSNAVLGIVAAPTVSFSIESSESVRWVELPAERLLPDGDAGPAVTVPCAFRLCVRELVSGTFKTTREEHSSGSIQFDSPFRTHGTRFLIRFANVRDSIRVFVTTRDLGTTAPNCVMVTASDPNGTYGMPADASSNVIDSETAVPLVEVPTHHGSGFVVWEWVKGFDITVLSRQLYFGVALVRKAGAEPVGRIDVHGSLAPVTTVTTPSRVAAIPRFVDLDRSQMTFTLTSTLTRLLFAFVTNQAGFDTGISIVNISSDPVGTPLETGACKINFYGFEGDVRVVHSYLSPTITGGEHFVWSLANGGAVQATPGFQGYVVAECHFPARGFAFISDLSHQKVASGYIAEVLPVQ